MKLISYMVDNDETLLAIQTIDSDGKTAFHPVVVVEGANGSEIMIAAPEVPETTSRSAISGRSMGDSILVITAAEDIFPALKAKLPHLMKTIHQVVGSHNIERESKHIRIGM